MAPTMSASSFPTATPGFRFVRRRGGIAEYRLARNGLRVLLLPEHSLPIASVMVTYHVGSRNEAVGHTGATHLLEHLLFKDSKHFRRSRGKDVWTLLEGKGALVNATTWLDRTNYFEVLPSAHVEMALRFEADRMRHALLTDADLASEMPVVRNEFERGENDPLEALDKLLWASAYHAHPYHHPTIGWLSDIEHSSAARLREFYRTFYWPDNATLTLVGDIEPRAALRAVHSSFGKLSPSPRPIPSAMTAEPVQEGPRHVVMSRRGHTNLAALAFKTPPALHPDTPALQVAGRVLCGGKESRLQRALVDQGLASEVILMNIPFKDAALCAIYAYLTPGTTHEKTLGILRREAHRLASRGITARELAAAKARIKAEAAMSRDGILNIAATLNEALAVGDWRFYLDFPRVVASVSARDISRAAAAYFREDRSTSGFFIAK